MNATTPRHVLGAVGVQGHLMRPTVPECVELVVAAEDAGADWCLLSDALGWRDVWMGLAAAAAATSRIKLGAGLTNPYTRHPVITLAALATLHEISEGRSLLGIAAGGSELTGLIGIDRSDAPERTRELVAMMRDAARGAGTFPFSVPIPEVPVIGGARGPRMLAAVGDVCDAVLVWAQTHELLQASAQEVAERGAAVAWAPLRTADHAYINDALVYGILNSPVAVRRQLGVDAGLEALIRERLMEGGMDRAASLIPDAAAAEFVVGDDVAAAQATARGLRARHVVVLAFETADVAARVDWAGAVAAGLAEV